MAKKQHSVSLSFLLMCFALLLLGSMLLCCLVWFFCLSRFQNAGFIYQGYVSNQQVEKMLTGNPKIFVSPDENFLAEYALFASNGDVLKSNVEGKKLEALAGYFQKDNYSTNVSRYTYADGSTAVFRWHYRAEFVNPELRHMLPPFQYLWFGTLGVACVLCLMLNILWLRRRLAAKLKLFSEVSEKIGAQDLDFTVPRAGIKEYDRALEAMEEMKRALYSSLSSQWAAQQEREAEIAALAHDLKTPLTIVGGNAELLLDEDLSENSRKMVESIVTSNSRAKQYVASLLEFSMGADEIFENASLPAVLDELYRRIIAVAESNGVCLKMHNSLEGTASIQKERLLRALCNVVQNAIEHTPAGRNVYLEGLMMENGWQVTVRDEGPGFSKAALQHATERLWRDDEARSDRGHNGLGLWFAAQVVKMHSGQIELSNGHSGGIVKIRFI